MGKTNNDVAKRHLLESEEAKVSTHRSSMWITIEQPVTVSAGIVFKGFVVQD